MAEKLIFDDGLDLEHFWQDNARAQENNCFNDGTSIALGIHMNDECVFAELGITDIHPWEQLEPAVRADLNRRYNDKAEQIVGRRFLREEYLPETAVFPPVKRIGEVFGGQYVWRGKSEWLDQGILSYKELEKVLEKVEKLDFREFMLPPGWAAAKKRIFEEYGLRPALLRGIRGPVTLACSVFGAEELIFLINDQPDLARRFSAAISHAVLEMARVMDEESGLAELPAGFSFNDDNCCLLSPDMYELFGLPILEKVFAHYSPLPGQRRYQHSDSDMGHLLPLLGRLDLNGVNFGPNVLIPQIRQHLPKARIEGCIAPFSFSRNDEKELVRQTRRDCLDGLAHGAGISIATAGSINYGSSLKSLRLIMSTIQQYGR